MRITIAREALLKPLLLVGGIVEKKQTQQILSNVLVLTEANRARITATDNEVEIVANTQVDGAVPGAITMPARKLIDICRTLPDDAIIQIDIEGDRAVVKSSKSRFVLATLPAADFPSVKTDQAQYEFALPQKELKRMIEKTQFAMAQQDVRYYLNGLMLEMDKGVWRAVATDGHRLAMATVNVDVNLPGKTQIIVPRKAITELGRLLENSDAPVKVNVGNNYLRVNFEEMQFTSKLIDGRFPDYERVLPKETTNKIVADRDTLRQCLIRASILSNEKYRGIRLKFATDQMQAVAQNPEQEQAEDEIPVQYAGPELDIGFNVNYLLDAVNAVDTQNVVLWLADSNTMGMLKPEGNSNSVYVVMPMRL
ncbi:MAG: DNA polymerase III subunit beta [Gammaproteobacteria bacterium]|nr:DNA polymerase III subunit beta [Gammaproteobacteria bacterium]